MKITICDVRYILFLSVLLIACESEKRETENTFTEGPVAYAQAFSIKKYNKVSRLEVITPFQGAERSFVYYLVPKNVKLPDSLEEKEVIRTPIEQIVVTSTSHIPMLDLLGESSSLVGFPSTDLVSSEAIRARIDSGFVAELGRDNELNYEVLVKLQPDLVMSYLILGDMSKIIRIQNAGIPVTLNADYLEHHPLGRAEWIKVAGLLFDKEKEADSIFEAIEKRYMELTELVQGKEEQPTVMTGIMYSDPWYLPGGNNYAANLFEDAGLSYLWEDNEESGFLQESFETIYDEAKDADLWIGTASIEDLRTLKNTDSRYSWFEPFKEGQVYTYTNKIGPTGGNEYLELGYVRPDIILADLIKIGHPELLPEWELYFYKKLDQE